MWSPVVPGDLWKKTHDLLACFISHSCVGRRQLNSNLVGLGRLKQEKREMSQRPRGENGSLEGRSGSVMGAPGCSFCS